MRRHVVLLALGLSPACAAASPAVAPAPAAAPTAWSCPADAEPFLRSALYFGLRRSDGAEVSEAEWKAFLDAEVTPRFPEGHTVWRVDGQWRYEDGRIAAEPSKLLLLLHPDTAANRAAIEAIRERFEQAFAQESVMWETAPAGVAF